MIFKTNQDNKEYLTIPSAYIFLGMLMIDSTITNEALKKEIETVYYILMNARKISGIPDYIRDLVLRKDSPMGQYLLTKSSSKNEDLIVTLDKVRNAFTIASFEGDPIAFELLTLFQNEITGSKEQLQTSQKESVLNYILEQEDFNSYLQKKKGTYQPKEYVVYEDGVISQKTLFVQETEKQKIRN